MSDYDRQVELAYEAGYDSVREYADARAEFREYFDTDMRGDTLAEAVGLWNGNLEFDDPSELGDFIAEMLEMDPDFDVDAFLDEVYGYY